MEFIPVNIPRFNGNEPAALLRCLEEGWISSEGPIVAEFEERFAAFLGRRHAVSVSSGTAALAVAVAALDLPEGSEVIVPSFTIISCLDAIVRNGLRPVLVDSDPQTWTMDVSQVAKRIRAQTRAIMPVHIYGLPVDLDPLLALARDHGLAVIEDAAEALGLSYKGKPCGTFGDAATFSFYANKTITTGEGGMIVTDRAEVAERARTFRNLCFEPGRRFVHKELGWNYRFTSLQAALGLAQLPFLKTHAARKREIGERYQAGLRGLTAVALPVDLTEYASNGYWVFGLLLNEDAGWDAASAMERLRERGVGTRPFFWPMHEQPVFQQRGLFSGERYPVAERLARRGFYLPSGLGMRDDQLDAVIGVCRELFS